MRPLRRRVVSVFPTRVGVDRRKAPMYSRCPCVPHARGGGPQPDGTHRWFAMCSPRAWGWTDAQEEDLHEEHVFPTRVGVDRSTAA